MSGPGRLTARESYLASLVRNVPYHISEAVLADPSPASAGSQSFRGTLLYADLVGFTALCDDLGRAGPDALSRLSSILGSFFGSVLERGLFPYDGYVVQFGGDSVTVAFRGEDHQLRAAAAGLATRDLTASMPNARRSDFLRLRVGLASGEVGLLVFGDQVQKSVVCGLQLGGVALAMQDRAEPGTIYADAATAEAIRDRANLIPRQGGAFQVDSLNVEVPRVPIAELGERVCQQTEEKIALLEPFVPPPMAARLRAIPENWQIEPELRDVVIIFSELRGIAPGELELASGIANELLSLFRSYGGIVMKTDLAPEGHRILSVFGLHSPTDIDCERALVAALKAGERIGAVAARFGAPLDFKSGIHRGEVYFGSIGSPYRYDITVIGDAVNTAARAASAASENSVVITRSVNDELRSDFLLSPLGSIQVKGKRAPLELLEVEGATGARARYVQKRHSKRRSVGREIEELALAEVVDEAVAGKGALIGICGEKGVGKSFLLAPMIDRWLERSRDFEGNAGLGLIGRCDYATRSAPLEPVIAMLNSYLGLIGTESQEQVLARVGEKLEGMDLGEARRPLVEFLLAATRQQPFDHLIDSEDARERLLSAIVAFTEQRLTQQPAVYVLENLHDADSLTLALVERLTGISLALPFLMIVTYRSSGRLERIRDKLSREFKLGNLGLRHCAHAVAGMFGAESVDEELASFLWVRTNGNPGQLTDLVRFLRDRGLVRMQEGAVRCGAPGGLAALESLIPSSMTQLALGRLEGLSEVERRLLRIASSIGSVFDRELLSTVAEASLVTGEVDRGLARLTDDGLILRELSRRESYRFREEVTRAVTYSTIPVDERRRYHAQIADAMENIATALRDRNMVLLARHRELANQYGLAAAAYQRAIEIALTSGLDKEVLELVSHWKTVAAGMSRDAPVPPQIRALVEVQAFVALARHEGPTAAIEAAPELIARVGTSMSSESRALFDFWYGSSLDALGRKAQGREALERAYEGSTDSELRADAALRLGRSYHGQDREQELHWLDLSARQLSDPMSDIAQRLDLARACMMAVDGRLDEARVLNASVRDKARQLGRLRIASMAANNLADCDLQSGSVEEALQGFEEALAMTRALGTQSRSGIQQLNIGLCHLHLGRPGEARRYLETAADIARHAGHALILAESLANLGLALALSDDIPEGERICEEGLRLAQEGNLRSTALAASLNLLHIALVSGERDKVAARLAACEGDGELPSIPLYTRQFLTLRARARAWLG